ncbi:cation:proton antiporter [Marisediminicola senii]|uniref:cation:proton antiporter n=1 Tax=Marisediminicola senii TaxID=2711233 RepID=UPI0013EA44F6|nr:cation:proton antiporter [Marisediminicola senii]
MIEFDGAGVIFAVIGVATLAAALLPRLLGRAPISMPMVFLAAGMVGFALIPDLPDPDPIGNGELAVHLTEVCVIVSLMGAGLALNRRIGWRSWSTTWRLLAITMPLSMLAVGILGWAGLGLGVASAVLLAAALAPTDPVLATEVQVSEPVVDQDAPDADVDADGVDAASDATASNGRDPAPTTGDPGDPDDTLPEAHDDEARFALTSEAGLNDGLAFPFTYAAIAMSLVGTAPAAWFGHWFLVDVLWRLSLGLAVGLGVGWMLSRLFFSRRAKRIRLAEQAEGFVALAATFLAYGATELIEGYGFVAVFVCACTIRASERSHGYHGVLHKFVEQVERLLTVIVVVLLGGAVARGLFDSVGWTEILFALAFLLVIRPVAGWIGLTPGKTGPRERLVIAFFGVRGIGSLFYIAYALQHGDFPDAEGLWAIVGLVVVASIVIHGVAATPAMALLDAKRERRAKAIDDDSVSTAQTPV